MADHASIAPEASVAHDASDLPESWDCREAELRNGLRIEAWQRDLAVGDCFCIVPDNGPVTYGIVVEPLPEDVLEPCHRRIKFFNKLCPLGVEQVVNVRYVELPMPRSRFDHARALAWPTAASAWRALLWLGDPASA
jgi:hypothetical protein